MFTLLKIRDETSIQKNEDSYFLARKVKLDYYYYY